MLEVVARFTSDNHPDKASWLDSVGELLLTRYERPEDVVSLEKSISMRNSDSCHWGYNDFHWCRRL